MPARDGTGPLGQGPRTGRGMGNCDSTKESTSQSLGSIRNKRLSWGGRAWNATVGRLLGRRRANRIHRK
jgi:hypothetical protein